MRAETKVIHKQGEFIRELSDRLASDVKNYESDPFYDHHCTIQDDIKRLRRELMELSKMFGWDYRKEKK